MSNEGLFVGRVYKKHRKFGNRWLEERYPVELMDHASNMEIGLCWYQKRTNNKSRYKLIHHLMVDLETIIEVAFMIYIYIYI